VLERQRSLELAPPGDLIAALPEQATFVDFFRYFRFAKEPHKTPVECCVAFVLRKGQSIRRVELGEAKPVDDALQRWRDAIDKGLSGRTTLRSCAQSSGSRWSNICRPTPTARFTYRRTAP